MAATIHLHQKFCFDSSWRLVLTLSSLSTQWINLINEDHGWSAVSGQLEKIFNEFFWLTLPFADKIWWWNREESTITFCCTRLGKETLTCSWRSVEQNTRPWLSGTLEKLWELYRHDDCFLKAFFGRLQSTDIFPLDVWLLCHDGWAESTLQLLWLFVVVIITVTPTRIINLEVKLTSSWEAS